MRIRILKLGHAAAPIESDEETLTVDQAIAKAGFDLQGFSLSLNGLGCGTEASVSDGDVVTMSPKVQGGVR